MIYRISAEDEISKLEYNGHLLGLCKTKKGDKVKYACLCVHCGKSVNIKQSMNMLFNPAYRIHFGRYCPRTTKIRWRLENKIQKIKRKKQEEYWMWLPWVRKYEIKEHDRY